MTLPLPYFAVVCLVMGLRCAERYARRTEVHDRTLAPVLALLVARVVKLEGVPDLVGNRSALGGLVVLLHIADVEVDGVWPFPGLPVAYYLGSTLTIVPEDQVLGCVRRVPQDGDPAECVPLADRIPAGVVVARAVLPAQLATLVIDRVAKKEVRGCRPRA